MSALALIIAVGLIPAYAGRTLLRVPRGHGHRAHPRLRGADSSLSGLCGPCWGSSPLTRGGLGNHALHPVGVGLIPAYAGRTIHRRNVYRASKAHPRLRGADDAQSGTRNQSLGSSPLTRGGPKKISDTGSAGRLIPAYAGRTYFTCVTSINSEAHPRLRGADRPRQSARRSPTGSSPLTRGGQLRLVPILALLGLIPAYAGRT